QLTFTPNWGT
uniref:Hypertrehalosaemic factor 2 n=2 Tax=Anareolatae TaxID=523720 RepID=HTF2_CARMO|nr:RecName: Full=Hypertrehalosaemic factor 2; AltName: Full=Hypertrehalosaemic factor II; Short=HRTH-II; Short=HTF-II; AltName: Full=Hypertrehalosaemic neuropeptide II [Carausius morosus]P62543.1 RecName: Full=Hypertrehalosaemic neuropeptide [Extatosoma tiaratum]